MVSPFLSLGLVHSQVRVVKEDFTLCKSEDQNPEHCLKEGRRVSRCVPMRDRLVRFIHITS